MTHHSGPVPPEMPWTPATLPQAFWIVLIIAFPVVTISGMALMLTWGGGVSGHADLAMLQACRSAFTSFWPEVASASSPTNLMGHQ